MAVFDNDATTTVRDGESGQRIRPGPASSPRSAPGQESFPRVAGRFLISEPLAAGGQATVHLARTEGSSSLLVVKRLHADLENDETFRNMLLDEARINCQVRHPNVVNMYGAEIAEQKLLLAMEYLEGVALNDLMRELLPSALPARIVAALMVGALRGLHAAHEASDENGHSLGIVHRDVSPQNIMVGLDGVTRVIDFGVAKAFNRLQATSRGEIKGKLAYMAPEQMLGGTIDRRTDVYGAGVVLWEALVAQPLFHGRLEDQTIGVDLPVPAPSEVGKDVPRALDAIVLRALAWRPEDRFQTTLEMARALERAFSAPPGPAEVAPWVRDLGERRLAEHARIRESLDAALASPSTRRPSLRPSQAMRPFPDLSRAETTATAMMPTPAHAQQEPMLLAPPPSSRRIPQVGPPQEVMVSLFGMTISRRRLVTGLLVVALAWLLSTVVVAVVVARLFLT